MRFHGMVLLAALVCCATSVFAWDQEDYEIFDLVSALEGAEGKGTTFYSFLNITKGATLQEINKASRRRGLELHPDKNPGVKDIESRFARLGVITAILRDAEKRKRYNYFYDNGVPKWKGTGYMYSRWQPGLLFALSFVLFVSTLCHLLVQHLTYRSELSRISRFRRAALTAAYGRKSTVPPSSIAQSGEKKKVRVPLEVARYEPESDDEEDGGGGGGEKGKEAGKGQSRAQRRAGKGDSKMPMVTMVVQGSKVWVQTEDGHELPLDESAANRPSLLNTFLPSLLRRLFSRSRSFQPSLSEAEGDEVVEAVANGDAPSVNGVKASGSGRATPTGGAAKKRKAKGRK